MARCLCLLGFLLSLLLSAVALGQVIKGGAETATFEPGDLTLYQEDLSGTPIGAQVEGWKIIAGTYEVAEFQDKRWFRPLTIGTHILRTLSPSARTSCGHCASLRISAWNSPPISLSEVNVGCGFSCIRKKR